MSLQTTCARGNILYNFLVYPSLTPAQVSGSTTATQTFTIPGLAVNDSVSLTYQGAQTTGISVVNTWVSTAGVLSVQFVNASGSAATPAAGVYILACDRLEGTTLPTNAA
jgi:hypothetical protein